MKTATPLNLRTITTESSIWIFNLDGMLYVRMPKQEVLENPSIAYTNKWEPFTKLEMVDHFEGKAVLVYRPVPYGTGALRRSGVIVEDSGEGNWPE